MLTLMLLAPFQFLCGRPKTDTFRNNGADTHTRSLPGWVPITMNPILICQAPITYPELLILNHLFYGGKEPIRLCPLVQQLEQNVCVCVCADGVLLEAGETS